MHPKEQISPIEKRFPPSLLHNFPDKWGITLILYDYTEENTKTFCFGT